ncbi:Acetylcholine receptor subunit alpha-type unc-38 [Lamellibrachia satsuma]|nr:Acetylcholine receptor subunit alpha-type unc-38 [Lamellibrachia satsuma]
MGQRQQVSLKLSMSLRRVIDLHEHKQVLTSSVSMGYYWRDTAYSWDPQKHNGTEQISVPKEFVWIPDILLYNNVDLTMKPLTKGLMLTIQYNGNIVYRYPAIFRSMCAVEMFPFDQHKCTLVFASWIHSSDTLDIDMATSVPTTDVQSYSSNSRWLLVNMSAERIVPIYNVSGQLEKFPAVVFSVVLRRRSLVLCWYLLYPNAITNFLAITVHLLPCDPRGKLTAGVLLFLATVFYLQLLDRHLPAHSFVPLIVGHVLGTEIISCLSQTISIIVLHLHHNFKTPLPAWVRRVFLYYLARVVLMSWVIRIEEEEGKAEEEDEVKVAPSQTSFSRVSSRCSSKSSTKTTATAEHATGDDGYFEGDDLGRFLPGQPLVEELSGPTFTSRLGRVPEHNTFILPSTSSCRKGDNLKGEDIKRIIMSKIDRCLQDFEDRTKRRLQEKVIRTEWKQVAMVIDRCMFYVYMFTTCYLWKLFSDRTTVYTDSGIE